MRKQKFKDGLLSPDEYWEKRLKINLQTEYIRYKKLCGKITKKEYRLLDGYYFITYCDWESYIKKIISDLDSNELI